MFFLIALSCAHATAVNPGGPGGGNETAGNSPGGVLGWQGSAGDVSTATGNKMTSVPIVSWTARGGLPVSFSLTHNSEATYSNFNGQKWTYSYLDFVVDNTSTVLVYLDDGSIYNFTQSGSGYSAPPGIHDTLVKNGSGNFTLTTKDQIAYQFTHVTSLQNYSFLTTITDENTNVITVTYLSSSSFAVYQVSDPTGRKITLAYDAYGHLSTVTDPKSRVWTLSYDNTANANCEMTKITFPTVNSTTPTMQFTYGTHYVGGKYYDAYDIVTLQDLNGNTAAYTYTMDGLGSIAVETDPKGNTTGFSYGATATTVTDANSHARVDTYDSSGRRTSAKDPLNNLDGYSYDSDNNVLTHTDRNNNTYTYTYDTGNANQSAHGNLLSALDPRNAAAHLAATKYTYTAKNRLATETKPSSTKVTLTYEGQDNLFTIVESYTNGQGQSVTAATTTLAYYTLQVPYYGLPISKTDNNQHVTLYSYDGNGDLATAETPKNNTTQWTYDALGFTTQRIDAMNRTTTYTPDGWERLVTTKYPDNSTHTFGYDNNSNLTAFSDPAIGVTRSYDKDNRITSESYGGAIELTNTYDAAGQKGLLSTSAYGTQTVTYAYTARNQLATVADAAGTSTYGYTSGGTAYPGYDNDGNQTQQTLANGARVGKVFDADSSLTEVNNLLPSGATASQFLYAYDLDGRKTTGSDATGSSMTWGYDGQSHLNSDARTNGYAPYHDGYALDSVGNRTATSNVYGTFPYTYDADDELTNYASGYVFAYNANGDIKTSTLNGHVSTLSYDYDDNLTGISSESGTVSYLYDALGRRIYRDDATGIGHTFVFQGSRLVAEFNDNTSTWDTQYTYGYDLLDKQGTGGTELPLFDGLGDTFQTLTPSGTYVLTADILNDFGQRFTAASGTDDLAYQWRASSGYRMDGDGLWQGSYNEPMVEVGARYYIPAMGVFITRDTDLSQKPYQYCNADPVNNVDPSGHETRTVTTTHNPDGSTSVTTTITGDGGDSISYTDTTYADGTVLLGTPTYSTTTSSVSPTSQALTDSGTNIGSIALVAGGVSLIPGVDALTAPFALALGGVAGVELLLGEYRDSIPVPKSDPDWAPYQSERVLLN